MARTARRLSFLVALLAALPLPPESVLARQAPPPLSDTIRAVLDRDGAEAARRRFAEIYPDQVEDYAVDMKAMADLGAEYMQAGDMARGQAVMEMVSTLARASIAENLPASMSAPSPAGRPDRRQAAEERAPRETRRAPAPNPLADDVALRYEGVFADPDESDPNRRFFIARDPCGPQLMFGAMWGDAENTYLSISSDGVLAQPPEQVRYGRPLRIDVSFGPDERAQRLTVDADWAPGALVRQGDLPEGWRGSPCTRG